MNRPLPPEAAREVEGVRSVTLVFLLFLGIYAMIYAMGFPIAAFILPLNVFLVLSILFALPILGIPVLYVYIYRRLRLGRVRAAMENAQNLTSVGLLFGIIPGFAMYTVARRLERVVEGLDTQAP